MKKTFRLILPLFLMLLFFSFNYLIDSKLSSFKNELILLILTVLKDMLQSFGLLSMALLIIRFNSDFIFDYFLSKKLNIAIPKFLFQFHNVIVFFVFIIIVLNSIYEVPMTALITASSALGVGMAFGLKDVLSDVFAGIAINIEQPFKLNEDISLQSGLRGTVIDITWRATFVKTIKETIVSIPNSKINSQEITNYHRPEKYYQIRDEFYLEYSIPPSKVKRIVLSALEAQNIDIEASSVDVTISDIDTKGVKYMILYFCTNLLTERILKDEVYTKVLSKLNEANLRPTYEKLQISNERYKELNKKIEPIEHLKNNPLFKTLEDSELEVLKNSLIEEFRTKGTKIVKQGESGDSLFIIIEGLLDVYIEDKKLNKDILVSKLESNGYFGEFSLLTGKERSATVVAKTDVILYEIKATDIANILENNTKLLSQLSEILANRQLGIQSSVKLESHKKEMEQKELKKTILSKMGQIFGLL